jgi:hypothetical protein
LLRSISKLLDNSLLYIYIFYLYRMNFFYSRSNYSHIGISQTIGHFCILEVSKNKYVHIFGFQKWYVDIPIFIYEEIHSL